MKLLASVCMGLALSGFPSFSSAQVTQTYSYDANGRVTGVTTTGSSGTNTAVYVYDDADNRTSRSQTGVSTWAVLEALTGGPPVLGTSPQMRAAVEPEASADSSASGVQTASRSEAVASPTEPVLVPAASPARAIQTGAAK